MSLAIPGALLYNPIRPIGERMQVILSHTVPDSVRAVRDVQNTRVFLMETRVVPNDAAAKGGLAWPIGNTGVGSSSASGWHIGSTLQPQACCIAGPLPTGVRNVVYLSSSVDIDSPHSVACPAVNSCYLAFRAIALCLSSEHCSKMQAVDPL
jgi:hypothetical protein